MLRNLLLTSVALLITAAGRLLPQTIDQGPSFSCAHVTSTVNRLICASPELSALDRELATVFSNMRGQPIDQKKLRRDEDTWLANMQQNCRDAVCIKSSYRARLAELRAQSLQAASPAAFAETQPFPAPAALLAQVQALVGTPCSYQPDMVGPVIPGVALAPGFHSIISAVGSTVVREKSGTRFAFLISSSADTSACQIRDVVVLPSSAVGSGFLQCSVTDPSLNGFGLRNTNTRKLEAFWSVNSDTQQIERVPIQVLGIEKAIKCRQPETGE